MTVAETAIGDAPLFRHEEHYSAKFLMCLQINLN